MDLTEAEAVAAQVEQEVRGHSTLRYAAGESRPGDTGEEVVAWAWAALHAGEPASAASAERPS